LRRSGFQNPVEVAGIGEVAVVEEKALPVDGWIIVKMIDASSVERGTAPNHSVDDVTLFQELFCKVRAVLPGDASDKRYFHKYFRIRN
jgi:hypothetical protein